MTDLISRLARKLSCPRPNAKKFLRFGLVGASGAIVNVGALIFLVNFLHLPVFIAGAIAIEVSIISNFTLNHYYTFRELKPASANRRFDGYQQLLLKLVRYNFVALGGAAITYLAFAILYKWLGLHYVLSDIAAILIAMGWNYNMSVRIVWKIVDE